MLDKHKGARSEMIACAYLLSDGYEVYRNVSQHGLIDIIAINEHETLHIDVKTLGVKPNGHPSNNRLSKEQIEAGVVALYVERDGKCSIDRTPLARANHSFLSCGIEVVRRGNCMYCRPAAAKEYNEKYLASKKILRDCA